MTLEYLQALKLAKSDLRDLSLKNLKKKSPRLAVKGNPERVAYLEVDGNYEASYLLFDKIWNKNNFPVNGDIVVYVPSRDTVSTASDVSPAPLRSVSVSGGET